MNRRQMIKKTNTLCIFMQDVDITDGDESDERGEQGVKTGSGANHERLL